jgi:hypothetical protein
VYRSIVLIGLYTHWNRMQKELCSPNPILAIF